MRTLWFKNCISYGFCHIKFFFIAEPESCLHHNVELLMCYISCSGSWGVHYDWSALCHIMWNSPLYYIQTTLVCSLETFALIRVIDRLVWRAGRVVHFLLHFIRHSNNHSRSKLGLVSNFFFLYNLVNFVHRDMCDTSMKQADLSAKKTLRW